MAAQTAPERDATPIARPRYVLWLQNGSGKYTSDTIDDSPGIQASDDPTSLTGLTPGELIIDPVTGNHYKANSSGTPVLVPDGDSIIPAAATELTIAAGIVAMTQSMHTVDTQADAASDDLDSITGGTQEQLLFLRPASASRTVVLKHAIGADLLACPGARDITLAEGTDWALLVYNGTQWIVLAFNTLANGGGGLGSALAATSNGLGASLISIEDALALISATTVEGALAELRTTLALKAATELTIAAGVVTRTQGVHNVDTEADAASDDLDSISGGAAGQFLLLTANNDARSVVVKHSANIVCPSGRDITLAEDDDYALLYSPAGTAWVVLTFKTLANGGGGLGSALAALTNGLGASLVGIEDAAAILTATTVEGALAEIKVITNAIIAENADVVIPCSHSGFIAVSGVWTRSRTAQGLYRIRRTAALTAEILSVEIPTSRLRSTASKGLKITGAKIQYSITTEAANDVTVSGVRVIMPATGVAVAAATSLGSVTYDTSHDTAAERGATGEHTMQVTFDTPVYLADGFVTLEFTVDDTTGGGAVFDLFLLALIGSETLVDAA